MTKLSELLKYYKAKESADDMESYYSESSIDSKIYILEMLLKGIGDVEIDDRILKTFIFEISKMRIGKFGMREIDADMQIKMYYDLIKDYKLTPSMVKTLFEYQSVRTFKFLFDDIKMYFDSGVVEDKKQLEQILDSIISKACELIKEEALKLEDLKSEYGTKFITDIQEIMKRRMIPYERVISILPSKELIDSSEVWVPAGYEISSGSDLVTRRLEDYITDKEIDETKDDDCIKLGLCTSGDYVYTSFTKKEYMDSLIKDTKKLIRKK